MEVPKELLTDDLMNAFLQYGFKIFEIAKADEKYYYRKRRFRVYFANSLKNHNLPGFKTASEKKIQY